MLNEILLEISDFTLVSLTKCLSSSGQNVILYFHNIFNKSELHFYTYITTLIKYCLKIYFIKEIAFTKSFSYINAENILIFLFRFQRIRILFVLFTYRKYFSDITSVLLFQINIRDMIIIKIWSSGSNNLQWKISHI